MKDNITDRIADTLLEDFDDYRDKDSDWTEDDFMEFIKDTAYSTYDYPYKHSEFIDEIPEACRPNKAESQSYYDLYTNEVDDLRYQFGEDQIDWTDGYEDLPKEGPGITENLQEATDFIPAWYVIKGADSTGEPRYVGLNPEHTSVRVITRGPYRINDMLFFASKDHAQQFADKVIAAKESRAQFNLAPEEYAPIKPEHNEYGYKQIETIYGKAYIAVGHTPNPRN